MGAAASPGLRVSGGLKCTMTYSNHSVEQDNAAALGDRSLTHAGPRALADPVTDADKAKAAQACLTASRLTVPAASKITDLIDGNLYTKQPMVQ